MLIRRLWGGILFGAPLLAAIIAGGVWTSLVFMVILGAGAIEFVHLAARRGQRVFGGLMLCWTVLFVLDRSVPWRLGMAEAGTALLLVLTLGWALIRYRQGTANAFAGFALTIGGSMYIGWGGAHWVGLRHLEDGLFWLLAVQLSIWGTDVFAYLVGRALGRTRLMPDVSPGKTWEGYIGAVAITPPVVALIFLSFEALGAGPNVTPLHGFTIAALVTLIAPLGDLGISILKRYSKVKDSGRLIPGHGGMLDRVDSSLVAGLIGYYYLTLFVLR